MMLWDLGIYWRSTDFHFISFSVFFYFKLIWHQSLIFIGRTDAEVETPILWPPDAKDWLIWKDPDAGKDWRQEEKGTDDKGWDGWMASLTQWTWVGANSRRQWMTGKPGVPQSMGSQHNWVTEQQHIISLACKLICWDGNVVFFFGNNFWLK